MGPSLPAAPRALGSLAPLPFPWPWGGPWGVFLGWGWGPWGALGSKGSAPCRNDTIAAREFGDGSKPDGAYKQVGGYARSVKEST